MSASTGQKRPRDAFPTPSTSKKPRFELEREEFEEDDDDDEGGVRLSLSESDYSSESSNSESEWEEEDELEEAELDSPIVDDAGDEPTLRKKGKGKAIERPEPQKTQTAARKSKKESVEEFLEAHPELQHLKPGSRKDILSLDIHDPASFTHIQVGDANERHWRGKQLPKKLAKNSDFGSCRQAFVTALTDVIKGRQAQVKKGGPTASVFPAGRGERLLSWDAATLAKDIVDHMPLNTSGTLGRAEFQLSDLNDMATFSAEDLRALLVYLGLALQADETKEVYAGSGTSENGSGARVIGAYEKSAQQGDNGVLTSNARKNVFIQRLLIPDAKAYLRPLVVYAQPEDEAEREEVRKHVLLVEAIMSDYLDSLKRTGVVTKGKDGRVLNSSLHETLTAEVAPKHRVKSWVGLNGVSPMYQGYSPGVSKARQVAMADLLEQGDPSCPICIKGDLQKQCRKNPLYGKVAWMSQKRVCKICNTWLRHAETLKEVISRCSSVEELRTYRESTKGDLGVHRRNRVKAAEKSERLAALPHDCPLCDEAFVTLNDGETNTAAKKRFGPSGEARRIPYPAKNLVSTFPWLSGTESLCMKDYNDLYKVKAAAKPYLKRLLKAYRACTTLAEARVVRSGDLSIGDV